MRKHKQSWIYLGLGTTLLAAGCGGGSSSSEAVVGLEGPDSMSVVTADSGSAPGAGISPSALEDFPSDAQYFTDEQHGHVYDPSMETLTTVNQILCMIGQTAYPDMVNQGDYNAQIDKSLCASGGDESSSDSAQSSGANAEQPEIWVVNSARASNDAPHYVHVWVPQKAGDSPDNQPATIFVRLQLDDGVSDANPFGVFAMDFAGVSDAGGSIDDPEFFGTLETLDVLDGFIGFGFYQKQGDPTVDPGLNHHAEEVSANVNMFADQSQGVARIHRVYRENYPGQGDSGTQTEEFLLAFNDTNVLREVVGGSQTCLSRTQFQENVWRYNLYYASGELAGQRVERNGGFPFKTESGAHGYASYYGLWLDSGSLESGDTVTKDEWGAATPQTFTVVQAPGKLIKHTRNTLALTELDGESFEWMDFSSQQGGPGTGGPPIRYLVEYQGGIGFVSVAIWDEESHEWEDMDSPEVLDTSAIGFLGMYSKSLGGAVNYVDGDEFVTYFAEEFVNGSSELLTGASEVPLYGYMQCLRSGILGSEADSGDIYFAPAMQLDSPYAYVFDAATLTLSYDVNGDGSLLEQVGLADGETISSGPFTWGMNSGPMVTDTTGLSSPFELWGAAEFYTYETGPNAWNQYAALIDSEGAPVAFDPPIQFTYTHATANDRNGSSSYDNKKFFLEYGGPGDLHGFPQQPVDMDDDGNPDRWYPVVSLADGVLMGPNGDDYVIKAIDMEQQLLEVPGECALMTTAPVADLELPDATGYTTPDNGAKPVVTDPPAVIAGEVQPGVLE